MFINEKRISIIIISILILNILSNIVLLTTSYTNSAPEIKQLQQIVLL